MIFSETAIAVLDNFQRINNAIVIPVGNEIQTVSELGTVHAHAVVPDKFSKPFAIFSLPKFLSVLSLDKDGPPVVTFDDLYCTIKHGDHITSTTRYYYCNPTMVKIPKGKVKFPPADVVFTVPAGVIDRLQKAMNIFEYELIAITGDGEKVQLSAIDSQNASSSSTFSVDISKTDKVFTMLIEKSKLQLIASPTYVFSISAKKIMQIKCEVNGSPIHYWIAPNDKSTFKT